MTTQLLHGKQAILPYLNQHVIVPVSLWRISGDLHRTVFTHSDKIAWKDTTVVCEVAIMYSPN